MAAEPSKWFANGFNGDSLRGEALATEHEQFKAVATKSAGRNLHLASTKCGLLGQIEDARHGNVSRRMSALEHFKKAAALQATKADKKRDTKDRMAVLVQFVDRYSPVVEAVASLGGPYGTVAYQTLSLLVSVWVNKVKNDNKVTDLLEVIGIELPRLEKWTSIYPTEAMENLISEAYLQILTFAREATKYLCRSSRRFALALPGAGINLDDMAVEIRDVLAKISDEAAMGLHQRSQVIQQDQQELLAKNAALQKELEEQRWLSDQRDQEDDKRRFTAFEDTLKARRGHPGTDVGSTLKALKIVFPDQPYNQRIPCTAYRQASRGLLEDASEYQAWLQVEGPALLFLSGRTAYHGRHQTGLNHSWLSPFAIYAQRYAQRYAQQQCGDGGGGGGGGVRTAFFSALPDIAAAPLDLATLLSSLVLQVLEWEPAVLRTSQEELERTLVADGPAWSVDSLIELLGRVLSRIAAEHERIFIIIDRLDLCVAEGKLSETVDQLARMVGVLEDASTNVKIVVVAETVGDERPWHLQLLPSHVFPPSRLFARQRWNQEKLVTWEDANLSRQRIWDS
ncbi:hypothetical protein F4780DRAFT_775263 [Xylariomycetidae sp. FL0641]|nr:hypothetical protein F4780DRAFT_775263 [Xylariomycetidae sp. FL0641]